MSPLLRCLAAMALVVFVVAQALCSIHCHFGNSRENATRPSCHRSSQASASHCRRDQSPPSAPATTMVCSTLKTMVAGGVAPTLLAPQFHTLYLLTEISLALAATEARREASFSRQSWTGDWVFTPVVCLGPALRSLAPPFVG